MSRILQFLSDSLQAVADFVTSIFSFFIQTVKGILNFISQLPKLIIYLSGSVGYLPSFLTLFATLTVAIAIAYVIIGRGGGKSD